MLICKISLKNIRYCEKLITGFELQLKTCTVLKFLRPGHIHFMPIQSLSAIRNKPYITIAVQALEKSSSFLIRP